MPTRSREQDSGRERSPEETAKCVVIVGRSSGASYRRTLHPSRYRRESCDSMKDARRKRRGFPRLCLGRQLVYRDRARRCHSHLNEPIQRTKSAQATHHERVLGKAKTLVGRSRTSLTVVPHTPPPLSLPTHKLVAAFTCYVKAVYFFFSCFFMFSDDLRLTSYSDPSKLSCRRISLMPCLVILLLHRRPAPATVNSYSLPCRERVARCL